MKLLVTFFLIGLTAMMSACAPVTIDTYKDTTPVADFKAFFTGPVTGYGVVYDRSGKVRERFTVEMVGSWEGDKGKLVEDFVYYSGRKQQRIWYLTRLSDTQFTGTADDIVGTATGRSSGSAILWNYVMKLPVGNSIYDIAFDDWMYVMDDKTIMNRAVMKKFGIRVGEVNVVMHKK